MGHAGWWGTEGANGVGAAAKTTSSMCFWVGRRSNIPRRGRELDCKTRGGVEQATRPRLFGVSTNWRGGWGIGSWGTGASNGDGVRVPPEGHRGHHQHTIDITYQGEDMSTNITSPMQAAKDRHADAYRRIDELEQRWNDVFDDDVSRTLFDYVIPIPIDWRDAKTTEDYIDIICTPAEHEGCIGTECPSLLHAHDVGYDVRDKLFEASILTDLRRRRALHLFGRSVLFGECGPGEGGTIYDEPELAKGAEIPDEPWSLDDERTTADRVARLSPEAFSRYLARFYAPADIQLARHNPA